MSTRWNLDTKFPYPFSDMFPIVSLFSLDFLSLECLTEINRFYFTVYWWSFLPIFIICASLGVLGLRLFILARYDNKRGDSNDQTTTTTSTSQSTLLSSSSSSMLFTRPSNQGEGMVELDKEKATTTYSYLGAKRSIIHQHIYFILFLTYLVLPSTSMKQLQSFDCVHLSKSDLYFLRVDTQIDCGSDDYIYFRSNVILLVVLYQLIPIVWMIALYRQREELNPRHGFHSLDEEEEFYLARDRNPNIAPLRFLVKDYKCNKWWFEVAEMYRRIVFIGVLPLVSSVSATRASFGCLLAIMSLVYFREEEPYWLKSTNLLAYVAQVSLLPLF
jgi:hypothetical protein